MRDILQIVVGFILPPAPDEDEPFCADHLVPKQRFLH